MCLAVLKVSILKRNPSLVSLPWPLSYHPKFFMVPAHILSAILYLHVDHTRRRIFHGSLNALGAALT